MMQALKALLKSQPSSREVVKETLALSDILIKKLDQAVADAKLKSLGRLARVNGHKPY